MSAIKRPVNIVLETGSLAGGVRVIGEVANRLAERGWPVAIWSVNPRETLTKWFSLSPTVKWHSFLKTGTVVDYQALADVLKKQAGIKLATFWRTAPAVADAMASGEGYYLIQDVETSYASQPLLKQLITQTYSFGLRGITTSKWVQAEMARTGLPTPEYIGIGLANHYRPNPKLKRAGFVLACARMQALKGWDQLCEVVRYMNAAGHHVTTYGLDAKLTMFSVTQHISKPTDDQIRRLYQQAGVFLSTSQHEGFNLTVLEAMATGTPVSTTNSEGNAEYLEPGENALVNSDPYELARNCAILLTDKTLAAKLSAAGPATAARYRWPDVIARVETAFLT